MTTSYSSVLSPGRHWSVTRSLRHLSCWLNSCLEVERWWAAVYGTPWCPFEKSCYFISMCRSLSHPAVSVRCCCSSPELLNFVGNTGQIWWWCRSLQPSALCHQRVREQREALIHTPWVKLEFPRTQSWAPWALLHLQGSSSALHQNQKFWHLIISSWLTWCPVACFAEFALLWKRQSYFRLKNAHFFKANGAVLEEIWNRNYLKAIWNTSPCKVNQCLHKDKCIYINKQKIFSLPCSFWRFRIKRKFSKYVDS